MVWRGAVELFAEKAGLKSKPVNERCASALVLHHVVLACGSETARGFLRPHESWLEQMECNQIQAKNRHTTVPRIADQRFGEMHSQLHTRASIHADYRPLTATRDEETRFAEGS